MTPATQVLLSGALTYGVPLLLAVRELVVLNRKPDGGWGPEPPKQPAPQPPGPIAGSLPQRPLPACLLVPQRPVVVASRELERV